MSIISQLKKTTKSKKPASESVLTYSIHISTQALCTQSSHFLSEVKINFLQFPSFNNHHLLTKTAFLALPGSSPSPSFHQHPRLPDHAVEFLLTVPETVSPPFFEVEEGQRERISSRLHHQHRARRGNVGLYPRTLKS